MLPAEALKTLPERGLHVPEVSNIASAPRASEARMIVPRFPGS